MTPPAPPLRISVVGGSNASSTELDLARAVGRELAQAGAILVCGGLGGVMAAAAEGTREAGGLTVGLLPGDEPWTASPSIALPLATGLGEARNVLVVRAGEAVIAIGGAWGTLSEIALAKAIGRPVVTLGRPPTGDLGLESAEAPEDAVAWALTAARQGRTMAAGGEAHHP